MKLRPHAQRGVVSSLWSAVEPQVSDVLWSRYLWSSRVSRHNKEGVQSPVVNPGLWASSGTKSHKGVMETSSVGSGHFMGPGSPWIYPDPLGGSAPGSPTWTFLSQLDSAPWVCSEDFVQRGIWTANKDYYWCIKNCTRAVDFPQQTKFMVLKTIWSWVLYWGGLTSSKQTTKEDNGLIVEPGHLVDPGGGKGPAPPHFTRWRQSFFQFGVPSMFVFPLTILDPLLLTALFIPQFAKILSFNNWIYSIQIYNTDSFAWSVLHRATATISHFVCCWFYCIIFCTSSYSPQCWWVTIRMHLCFYISCKNCRFFKGFYFYHIIPVMICFSENYHGQQEP